MIPGAIEQSAKQGSCTRYCRSASAPEEPRGCTARGPHVTPFPGVPGASFRHYPASGTSALPPGCLGPGWVMAQSHHAAYGNNAAMLAPNHRGLPLTLDSYGREKEPLFSLGQSTLGSLHYSIFCLYFKSSPVPVLAASGHMASKPEQTFVFLVPCCTKLNVYGIQRPLWYLAEATLLLKPHTC